VNKTKHLINTTSVESMAAAHILSSKQKRQYKQVTNFSIDFDLLPKYSSYYVIEQRNGKF
jgi:hypothetical protein